MKNNILLVSILFLCTNLKAQFFTTPYGKKYHRGDCKLVERNSYESSESAAKSKNKQPCKICLPNHFGSGGGNIKDEPVDKCERVQCSGITKKGTRCKHKTTICNGLCYEHGQG